MNHSIKHTYTLAGIKRASISMNREEGEVDTLLHVSTTGSYARVWLTRAEMIYLRDALTIAIKEWA